MPIGVLSMKAFIIRLTLISTVAIISLLGAQARDLVIVAHRGANHLAPENTFASTDKCIELGVDYVEIDCTQAAMALCTSSTTLL